MHSGICEWNPFLADDDPSLLTQLDPGLDYEAMTKAELQAIAAERDLKIAKKATKADLVQLLEQDDAQAAEAADSEDLDDHATHLESVRLLLAGDHPAVAETSHVSA